MNGYTESDEHVEWRMNRRRLQNIEAIYGADWEDTSSKLRAAVELADAQEFLTDSEVPADRAYRLEKAMNEDPRTPAEKAADLDWQDEQATRADIRTGFQQW